MIEYLRTAQETELDMRRLLEWLEKQEGTPRAIERKAKHQDSYQLGFDAAVAEITRLILDPMYKG